MDNMQRRIDRNVAGINGMRSRPMTWRGWLTLLVVLAIGSGVVGLAVWGGDALTATYNAGTAPAQDRIAAWLDGPDSAERAALRSWLAERGVEGSETLWLISAAQEDLDAAIDDLRIPPRETRE